MSCDCVCHACGEGISEPVECEECGSFFEKEDMEVINGELYCNTCHYFEIKKYMTSEQVTASFEMSHPVERYYSSGGIDRIARAEDFSNYVDMLCRDKQITEELARDIDNPF